MGRFSDGKRKNGRYKENGNGLTELIGINCPDGPMIS